MALNPNDPFFEGSVRNIIQEELERSRLSVLVRQLQRYQFQHGTTALTTNGGGAAGGLSITWAEPFPDTAYTVVGFLDGNTTVAPMLLTKTATGLTFQVNGAPASTSMNAHWIAVRG